jgi:LysM repeat protein
VKQGRFPAQKESVHMKIMYDSVNASKIPPRAEVVAGYVDGKYRWSDSDWDRFGDALRIGICVDPHHNLGDVLDIEPGDSEPAQAVDWTIKRRNSGIEPVLYTNTSTKPFVTNEFYLRKVKEPEYWIAVWNGRGEIPAGSVAHQFQNCSGFDLSTVTDEWFRLKKSGIAAKKPKTEPKTVPTAPSFLYRIQWGDTLTGIARKFGTSVSSLVALNAIKDPNVISAGSIIKVPVRLDR